MSRRLSDLVGMVAVDCPTSRAWTARTIDHRKAVRADSGEYPWEQFPEGVAGMVHWLMDGACEIRDGQGFVSRWEGERGSCRIVPAAAIRPAGGDGACAWWTVVWSVAPERP